jgi:hypothetical protein
MELRAKRYEASITKLPNKEGTNPVSIADACPGVSTHVPLTTASVSRNM